MIDMRGGPLIKGSRDYVTAPPDSRRDHSLDFFAMGIPLGGSFCHEVIPYTGHQGKMNRTLCSTVAVS